MVRIYYNEIGYSNKNYLGTKRQISKMDLVYCSSKMAQSTKVSSKMVSCVEKVEKSSLMESTTLESLQTTRQMVRVCSKISKVAVIMECGRTINSMAMGRRSGRMELRLILVSSLKARRMEKER